ncbi:MAG TPA: dTDP-4-dehydrorhamnose 3,5-epimerase family protein [Candidatus Saccharimonadales bacterium]|nr:dTDP-4-dehydrorhamnose 3,5-epimerase family protein [Candidatus Saccharimonadales bacterium]
MKVNEVTENWLKSQKFEISKDLIDGVVVKNLKPIVDGRGDVIELWSQPWIATDNLMQPKHCYQSATDYGVTKCWHLHSIHTDQFTVTRGKLQVCLIDVREDSPTFGKANSIILGRDQQRLIKIPTGILHGWKSLSQPETIVVNFQTEVYDANDEFKFTWDCVIPEIWEPKNG